MAETLVATSPLQGYAQKLAQLPSTVSLAEEPFVAMVDLWVDPNGPAASQVSTLLGVDLPTTPSTYVRNEAVTVIWLGPEEWLVTGSQSAPALEAELNGIAGVVTNGLFARRPADVLLLGEETGVRKIQRK